MAAGSAFTWGAGGAKLTPEQLALARAVMARKKSQGVDTSPIGHWTAGAARIADALGDVIQEKRLNSQESELNDYNKSEAEKTAAYFAGTSPVAPPVASAATSGVAQEMAATSPAPTIPQTADATYIRAGLIKRGLPAHIADGFVLNFQDESGLNPGINEAAPLVPGSRGGFGLYQLTGPRRVAYENYVNGLGIDPSNTDAQLDFLSGELGLGGLGLENQPWFGSEKGAAEGILSAGDTSSAAQAIVNNFLRPSQEHRERRAASYARIGGESPASTAIEAAAPTSGYVDPMVSAPNYVPPEAVAPEATQSFDAGRFGAAPMAQAGAPPEIYTAQTDFAPQLPPPVNVAAAPAVAEAPQQVAQAPQAPPANNAAIAQALRVMSDPRANDGTRRVAQALLQQEQQKQAAAQEQAIWQQRQEYERAQQASDPYRQLQIQKMQQDVSGGSRQSLVNAGDGRLYDPNNQSWITAPDAERKNFRQATPDEVKVFGTNGQVGPDGRFYPVTPPQGTALSVDPNTGAVSFNQGPGVKPLTEAQSKDSFFTTRMTAATPTIDKFESALMSLPESVAGAIPMNLGRYAQSEEFQLAKDAGRDFVNAYLRKDSGAALTAEEEANYGQLLLPQPGDKPAILAAKRQRRQIATEAIKSGMPPSAVDGVLKAIQSVPGADQPAKTSAEINGYKIEEVD